MKLMTKEEKILKEGLEKVPEKKDNMSWISSLAFCNPIGLSSFFGQLKTWRFYWPIIGWQPFLCNYKKCKTSVN
jgi:hypothetical protein